MLRLEARNAETPIERKPPWIKIRAKMGPEYTAAARAWCSARACTRSARRPAAPTSTSAGRTARPRSSSAATSAPAAATSARSTPASRPSSTATSRAGSPSPSRRWACGTPRSPASPATTCPTAARGCTPRRSARSTSCNPATGVELLIPDFNADPEQLAEVFGAAPGGPGAQRRDRAAHLQADPARLSATSGRSTCSPSARAAGLVTKSQPDPRAWARRREEVARRCATCTTPAAS